MTRFVYDEGVELFQYIYGYYGTRYFSELERRVITYHSRRSRHEFRSQMLQEKGVELSESIGTRLGSLNPGEMEPDIGRELQNGLEDFKRRTGQSALRNHGDKMTIPRCARCNALLRAPKARQCVWCGHSWFDAA